MVIFFGLAVSPLVAKDNDKINRKVLVLDFVNVAKNKDVGYLSGSIADALLEPLEETKSFTILPRSAGQSHIESNKIPVDHLGREDVAREIGQATGADVVVVGSFIALGKSIQIQTRAVDVLSGRPAVSLSKTGKLDSTVFTLISKSAKKMAGQMKNALPPLDKREVVERMVFMGGDDGSNLKNKLHFTGGYVLPLLEIADYYGGGFIGGRIAFEMPAFAEKFSWLATGQFQLMPSSADEKTALSEKFFATTGVGIGYYFTEDPHNQLGALVTPVLGLDLLPSPQNQIFFSSGIEAGLFWNYYPTRGLGFTLRPTATYIFDDSVSTLYLNLQAGFSVRF